MKKRKLMLIAILLITILNINYLGFSEKKIVITNKSYKIGNDSNLVLNKILSDNELKTEIPKMFNYASNGNYFDYTNWEMLNNPKYITEGLYSNKDEDGTTYYYRGDIDNNNLVFGAYDEDYYVYYYVDENLTRDRDYYFQTLESCQEAEFTEAYCQPIKLASKGDKMYWKIVRVNGDGSIRLIYNGPGINSRHLGYTGPMSFSDKEISGVIGGSPYNLETDDPKYMGYTYDNGIDSFVKNEVDTWYDNTLGSNPDYDKYVILGRFCSDSSGFNLDGNEHFASYYRLGQVVSDFINDNAPTFSCPNTSESYGGSYRLKVGLITADEIVFAGENDNTLGNSYLNPGEDGTPYFTMTPIGGKDIWQTYASYLSSVNFNEASGIRPVINVSTEGMTLVGDGTIDNPYVLKEVENNNYKGKVTIEEGSSVDDYSAFIEEIDLSGKFTWTSEDNSIAKIENGKILGLKEGITTIKIVKEDGTTYEIEVTVIKNPKTNSMIYVGIGIILILILSTVLYSVYRIKLIINRD